MAVVDAPPADPTGDAPPDEAKKHIRGSSLLLVGRVIAMGLNFVVQILTVRYLTRGDYGAFAWALSIAFLGSSIAVLGLEKTIGRFIAIYQEEGDNRRICGTIALAVGSVLAIGFGMVLAVWLAQDWISGRVLNDKRALPLLLALIFITPLKSLDSILVALFAVFASPRAIFFRRHLLEPALNLAVTLTLVLGGLGAGFLAGGYVAASVVGIVVCLLTLGNILREKGLLGYFRPSRLVLPAREVFSFTLPLLSSNVLWVASTTLVVALLEYFGGTHHVAAFRAVLPVATLNAIVADSFRFLFTPQASRMFAREDGEGIHELYWQTVAWVAVLTFPILAVSCILAEPTTLLLFGTKYADAGEVLAILALGQYVISVFGFDGMALRVYGRVQYIVKVDVLVVLTGLILNFLLIPRYGAVGGAIGSTATMIGQGLLYHLGLSRQTAIRTSGWRSLQVYLIIAGGAGVLFIVQRTLSLPIYLGIPAAAIVWLAVLRVSRGLLSVEQTFPELLRLPLVRQLFASGRMHG